MKMGRDGEGRQVMGRSNRRQGKIREDEKVGRGEKKTGGVWGSINEAGEKWRGEMAIGRGDHHWGGIGE